jgi:hypothetical protein
LSTIGGDQHLMLELHPPVRQNMAKFGPLLAEHLSYKEAAVAIGWLTATAHQREPVFLGAVYESGNRLPELGLGCHTVVPRVSLGVVVLVTVGSTSQRFP